MGMIYTEIKNDDELVHSTPGSKKKKITHKKEINTKKMKRLSRSHPISLPHSGELFVMAVQGESRKKMSVLVGAGQLSQGLHSNPGGAEVVSSFFHAESQGGFWVA